MASGLIPMLDAQQLYEKLKDIKVGSPLCQFTEEHCRDLLATAQERSLVTPGDNDTRRPTSYPTNRRIVLGAGRVAGGLEHLRISASEGK